MVADAKPTSIKQLHTAQDQEKQVHNVEIAGVPFRLKSFHDTQTVEHLVCTLNAKIQEILPHVKNQSLQNAVFLAALNLVEVMFNMKTEALRGLNALEEKVEKLTSDFESLQLSPMGQGN